MIKVLRNLLQQLIDDIDAGNSNVPNEEDLNEIINIIQRSNSKQLSKIEAANYLGVCRATFDNYIDKGLIPKGKKRSGWKELSWKKYDLDKYLLDNNKLR